MKSTPRVIVPFTDNLDSALLGVGAYVRLDDILEMAFPVHADISTVEKDGCVEGTLLYFKGFTPHDLFPHKFKQR